MFPRPGAFSVQYVQDTLAGGLLYQNALRARRIATGSTSEIPTIAYSSIDHAALARQRAGPHPRTGGRSTGGAFAPPRDAHGHVNGQQERPATRIQSTGISKYKYRYSGLRSSACDSSSPPRHLYTYFISALQTAREATNTADKGQALSAKTRRVLGALACSEYACRWGPVGVVLIKTGRAYRIVDPSSRFNDSAAGGVRPRVWSSVSAYSPQGS